MECDADDDADESACSGTRLLARAPSSGDVADQYHVGNGSSIDGWLMLWPHPTETDRLTQQLNALLDHFNIFTADYSSSVRRRHLESTFYYADTN